VLALGLLTSIGTKGYMSRTFATSSARALSLLHAVSLYAYDRGLTSVADAYLRFSCLNSTFRAPRCRPKAIAAPQIHTGHGTAEAIAEVENSAKANADADADAGVDVDGTKLAAGAEVDTKLKTDAEVDSITVAKAQAHVLHADARPEADAETDAAAWMTICDVCHSSCFTTGPHGIVDSTPRTAVECGE
jgi:hypothetical protein